MESAREKRGIPPQGQLDIASECWFGGRVAGGSDPVVAAVYAVPAGAVRCRHLTWMSWLRIARWK